VGLLDTLPELDALELLPEDVALLVVAVTVLIDAVGTVAVAVVVSLPVVAVTLDSIVKRGEKLSSETEDPAEISML